MFQTTNQLCIGSFFKLKLFYITIYNYSIQPHNPLRGFPYISIQATWSPQKCGRRCSWSARSVLELWIWSPTSTRRERPLEVKHMFSFSRKNRVVLQQKNWDLTVDLWIFLVEPQPEKHDLWKSFRIIAFLRLKKIWSIIVMIWDHQPGLVSKHNHIWTLGYLPINAG